MTGARSVRHAGIVVDDLERSLAFYCGVLGFAVKTRADEEGPFIDQLLGLRDVRVTTAKLMLESGGAMLELLRFHNPPADGRRALTVKTFGPTHVSLTVTDLMGLAAKLSRAGATLVGAPQRSPDGKVLAMYCTDPEGNYLELVEELKE